MILNQRHRHYPNIREPRIAGIREKKKTDGHHADVVPPLGGQNAATGVDVPAPEQRTCDMGIVINHI